jgi:hypothetical protein
VDLLNIWTAKYARLADMLVPSIFGGPTTGTFHTRAKNQATGEQLALETGPLEEWCPDMQELVQGIEDEEARQCSIAHWQHVAVSQSHIVAVHLLKAYTLHVERLRLLLASRMAIFIRQRRLQIGVD